MPRMRAVMDGRSSCSRANCDLHMTPSQPLTVTLEAQQWNAVMALLAEGPYRISAALIQAIQSQCMQQAEAPADNVTQLHEAGC